MGGTLGSETCNYHYKFTCALGLLLILFTKRSKLTIMERWRLMAFVLVVMFQQPEARYQSVRCLVWCLKQGLYEFKIDVRLRVVMLREYLIGLTCVACGARRDWPNLP